jgi:hypothetical protein
LYDQKNTLQFKQGVENQTPGDSVPIWWGNFERKFEKIFGKIFGKKRHALLLR